MDNLAYSPFVPLSLRTPALSDSDGSTLSNNMNGNDLITPSPLSGIRLIFLMRLSDYWDFVVDDSDSPHLIRRIRLTKMKKIVHSV